MCKWIAIIWTTIIIAAVCFLAITTGCSSHSSQPKTYHWINTKSYDIPHSDSWEELEYIDDVTGIACGTLYGNGDTTMHDEWTAYGRGFYVQNTHRRDFAIAEILRNCK
jgi:hypothetical protein